MNSDTAGPVPTSRFFSPETVEEEFLATLESLGSGFIVLDAEWRVV